MDNLSFDSSEEGDGNPTEKDGPLKVVEQETSDASPVKQQEEEKK
jgi:hypothetical protein